MIATTSSSLITASPRPPAERERRILLLPGPHKTASSSVQQFLVLLQTKNLLQRNNWKWPAANSGKALAPLPRSLFFGPPNSSRHFENVIARERNKGYSIVIGAELFDYIAAIASLREKELLPTVLGRLKQVLPSEVGGTSNAVEVVVMYRTPRASHLVSTWKQEIAMTRYMKQKTHWPWRTANVTVTRTLDTSEQQLVLTEPPPSLAEWLCHSHWTEQVEYHVDTIVASQLNPMGIANVFSTFAKWNVTVVDMSGVSDLPNMVACEILQLPCTDKGKVLGMQHEKQLQIGKRPNPVPLGLSNNEMEEVESVIRRMDCNYYCGLRGNVTILHANDAMFTQSNLWSDCCLSPETFLSSRDAYEKLRMIGCRASSADNEGGSPKTGVTTQSAEAVPNGEVSYSDMHIALKHEPDDGVELLVVPSFTVPMLCLILGFVGICLLRKRRKPRNHIQ